MKIITYRWILRNVFFVFVAGLFIVSSSGAERNESEHLQEVFQKGQTAYQEGDYPKAIEYYEETVKINPDFVPVYNALGLAHHAQKEKVSNVVWFFYTALDIDPKCAEAYGNLCRVYYENEMFEDAEQSCLKALELDPDNGPVQLSLSWVYLLGKKMPAKAITYFDQVLKKTRSPIVYFGRGIAYGEIGDSSKVIETITTLRDLGNEELATQLEDSLRKSYIPPTNPDTLILPEPQPGTIVPAYPEKTTETPWEEDKSQNVSGSMRIRLRGKLGPAAPRE